VARAAACRGVRGADEPSSVGIEPWLATWQQLATDWQPTGNRLATDWQPGNQCCGNHCGNATGNVSQSGCQHRSSSTGNSWQPLATTGNLTWQLLVTWQPLATWQPVGWRPTGADLATDGDTSV
jgi:hypothetical protein